MDAILGQQNLFVADRQEFLLWSAKDQRVLLRQNMTAADAENSNGWLKNSLCGHLRWRAASELKVKTYTIKR